MIDPTLSVADWVLLGAFCLAIPYAVVGNMVLFFVIKEKSGMSFLLGGLAVLAYFRLPRGQRSLLLDLLAVSVLLSLVVVIVTAILLYPRIWA